MTKYGTDGLIASACGVIDMTRGEHSVEYTYGCASLANAYAKTATAEEPVSIGECLKAASESLEKVTRLLEVPNAGDDE